MSAELLGFRHLRLGLRALRRSSGVGLHVDRCAVGGCLLHHLEPLLDILGTAQGRLRRRRHQCCWSYAIRPYCHLQGGPANPQWPSVVNLGDARVGIFLTCKRRRYGLPPVGMSADISAGQWLGLSGWVSPCDPVEKDAARAGSSSVWYEAFGPGYVGQVVISVPV